MVLSFALYFRFGVFTHGPVFCLPCYPGFCFSDVFPIHFSSTNIFPFTPKSSPKTTVRVMVTPHMASVSSLPADEPHLKLHVLSRIVAATTFCRRLGRAYPCLFPTHSARLGPVYTFFRMTNPWLLWKHKDTFPKPPLSRSFLSSRSLDAILMLSKDMSGCILNAQHSTTGSCLELCPINKTERLS